MVKVPPKPIADGSLRDAPKNDALSLPAAEQTQSDVAIADTPSPQRERALANVQTQHHLHKRAVVPFNRPATSTSRTTTSGTDSDHFGSTKTSSRWSASRGNGDSRDSWAKRGSMDSYSEKPSLRRSSLRRHSLLSLDSIMSSASSIQPPSKAKTAFCVFMVIAIAWFVGVCILLVSLAGLYRGVVVDDARQRYAISASARIATQVNSVLSGAIDVRDAIHYAIQTKMYFDPLDYIAARTAVESIFATTPSIRAVDFAFVGRNESFSIRSRLQDGLYATPLVQSDAADCFEVLGELGCLRSIPVREQVWFSMARELAESRTADTFKWLGDPTFVPKALEANYSEKDVSRSYIAWSPAYSLVFRSPFPGTKSTLSVLGRVTLDISELRADGRLEDSVRMGPGGAIFICNNQGAIVASSSLGTQAFVRRGTGSTRIRFAWELAAEWAMELAESDFKAREARRLSVGNFLVSVLPLTGRGLQNFRALVAVERGPFVDESTDSMCGTALTTLWLPYPFAALVVFCVLLRKEYVKRREIRRVHLEPPQEVETEHVGGHGHHGDTSTLRSRLQKRGGDVISQQSIHEMKALGYGRQPTEFRSSHGYGADQDISRR